VNLFLKQVILAELVNKLNTYGNLINRTR